MHVNFLLNEYDDDDDDDDDEAALTGAGKAFQARAAATGKARSPSVTRLVDGTISVGVAADRSRRSCSTSADWRRRVSAR